MKTTRQRITAAAAGTVLALGGVAWTTGPAQAAAGCAVSYQVSSQWGGGFQGAISVRNTGDPLTAWTLTFTFPDGQTVSQGWGGQWSTGSSSVTVANESYNGALGSGASADLGFIATWNNASNRAPSSFALNGTTCAGGGQTTTTTTSGGAVSTTTTRPTSTTTTRSTTTTTSTSGGGWGPAPDPALRARCTGTSPITCHYDVAPGNYDLTVVLGDPSSAGNTSLQAEARRTLLIPVSTAAGQTIRYGFTVNVRQPEGQPTGQGGTGTAGLDLVLAGSAPRLNGIGLAAASSEPVLYLAGDSTVCDQPTAPYTGWGQELPKYVAAGMSVANYADSGESSGSFLNNSALFPTMRPLLTSRDTVLIQFGHNDKTTTAAAFTSNLTSLITQTKARGATPILVTPPVRRQYSGGQLTPTALHVNELGVDLPAVMKQVAAAQNVALIDLTARSRALVESLGTSGSSKLYLTTATDGVSDNTHFSVYGADQMARLVLQAVRDLNLPLAARLR